MSSDAIEAWQATVTPELLEAARQTIDAKHRSEVAYMELVGQYLAVKQRSSKGYCNESHVQIYEGLHRVLTVETIGRALRCLDYPGLWQIVKAGAKGSPTQRVLTSCDPHELIQSHGAIPPHDDNATHGDIPPHDDNATYGDKSTTHGATTANARGLHNDHTGLLPRTPKELPTDLPKYSPNYPQSYDA